MAFFLPDRVGGVAIFANTPTSGVRNFSGTISTGVTFGFYGGEFNKFEDTLAFGVTLAMDLPSRLAANEILDAEIVLDLQPAGKGDWNVAQEHAVQMLALIRGHISGWEPEQPPKQKEKPDRWNPETKPKLF